MRGRKYSVTIRFRASPGEAKALKTLAAHYARTESDVLRLLVSQALALVERARDAARPAAGEGAPKKRPAVATQ